MWFLLLGCFLAGFAGYAIGRIGHIYGGRLNGPHHWIPGAFLFLPGAFFTNTYMLLMFSFGAGLIISDLKDFLDLKIWGADDNEIFTFWGID